jgi:hypothetical protein
MPGFLSRDFIRPLGTIIIQTERLLTNQTRILPGWKKINTTNASCCSRSRTDPTNKKITYPKLSPKHYYNYYSYLKKYIFLFLISLLLPLGSVTPAEASLAISRGGIAGAAPCAITAPPPPSEGPSSNKDTRDVWGGIGVE